MAYDNKVILMIDAEESWMQDAVDHLVNEMMEKYNQEKAYIWNTIKCTERKIRIFGSRFRGVQNLKLLLGV